MVHAEWRRTAVAPVLAAYAGTDGVDAVMLGGSTARGDADRWSDVEVGVFWSRRPTMTERLAPAPSVRPGTPEDSGSPWYDYLSLDGLAVDVEHALSSAVEETLDRVLGAGVPDPSGLGLLKGLVDGRELGGRRPDLIAGWQQRAATYPRELAVAIVERDGAIDKFWRWQLLAERDNPVLLAREFLRMTSQLLSVLHAVNGRYCGHPLAFKRLDAMETELIHAPPNLAARLRTVFTSPPPEAAEALRQLIEETYDVLETRLPEVDVPRLRARFHTSRQPIDPPRSR
ncbi:nucleotidyltransferase domain-containing protein [Kribbella sp. NPDC026611]|uniref:nucleotidyltransferase domain-containing protein n=1 Tax=Kribbella sp. NPDC026611 TaxID=3154911 RepID=UPI0033DAD3F6